jgi:hypothetical protein
MMMADEDAAASDETTSDDEATVDDTETPSADDAETEEEPTDEGSEDESDDEDKETPPSSDPALVNLEKKFAHIKDPEQRRVAVAKAYWEKTNYASKTRRENEALERRIAEIESRSKAPEKEKEPPPPDPDIVELDQRIQVLKTKDAADVTAADAQLTALNEVDTEIAKLQGKLEDAKEAGETEKAALLESRIETKQTKREGIIGRYEDIRDRRVSRSYDLQRLTRDRAWLENVIADRTSRQAKEQDELNSFKSEFPEKVDALIEGAASRLGIPESLTDELLEEVNEGLLVDFFRLGDGELDEADLPALVKARVEKFARSRDLARRQRFSEQSKAKAKVAAPVKAGASTPETKRPVAPAQMTATGLGPKMGKARAYLASKGWG